MGKPRTFMCLPSRAMADTRLSALDARCLMVIAYHDGMSLTKGTGMGCYAKLATLAELVQTDIANLSRSVSRLIKFGYVLREPQQGDKRRYTHRVIYGEDDSWRNQQQSGGEIVGEINNNPSEEVGEINNQIGELVVEPEYLSDGKSEDNRVQYISLKEEIDFVETRKINSAEAASLACGKLGSGASPGEQPSEPGMRTNGAEAPAIRKVPLRELLPSDFHKLAVEEQLERWDDAFASIDRDPGRIAGDGRQVIAKVLHDIALKHFTNDPVYKPAARLWEQVRPHGRGHASAA